MWLQNLCLAHFNVKSEHLENIDIAGEKLQIQRSIVTNIRPLEKKSNETQESLVSSVVAPQEKKETDTSLGDEDGTLYSHVREFKVDIMASEKSAYVFVFNGNEMQYCPTRSNMQLKRRTYERDDTVHIHSAVVKRRKNTAEEGTESLKLVRELSS